MQANCQFIVGRKVRFALAGCGRIAGKHFEALNQHEGHAELIAVCDVNVDRLRAQGETVLPLSDLVAEGLTQQFPPKNYLVY